MAGSTMFVVLFFPNGERIRFAVDGGTVQDNGALRYIEGDSAFVTSLPFVLEYLDNAGRASRFS
jgi:hypothetical protein